MSFKVVYINLLLVVLTLAHQVQHPDARVTEILMPCLVHHFIQGVQLEDVVDQVVIAIREETVQGHEVARMESRVVCRVVSKTKILSKKIMSIRSSYSDSIDPPFDIPPSCRATSK